MHKVINRKVQNEWIEYRVNDDMFVGQQEVHAYQSVDNTKNLDNVEV